MVLKPRKASEVGDLTEAIVATELLKRGVSVYFPWASNGPFDLVIYNDNRFYKVQCKTTYRKGPSLIVNIRKTNTNFARDSLPYSKDEVDAFAAYSFEEDKVYLMPYTDRTSSVSLRLGEPTNGAGVRWAAHHDVDQNDVGTLLGES